jgi:nucleotide-binding universal stress UspA family protein
MLDSIGTDGELGRGMTKRILVAIDRSPRAEVVLARAVAIAKSTGAELYLLHAVSIPVEVPAEAFTSSPTALVEQWRKDAIRDLEKRSGTVDPTIVTHVLARAGSPWSAICASAKEHDVDLIVIGSHGYDALDHLLGTTASKVVNHADRSVLVVREPKRA